MRLGFIAAAIHGRKASRLAAAALLAFAQVGGALSAPPVQEDSGAPQDWYHIIRIDARTYAISEPKYWQRNVSYLILGSRQALLFDTGPGIYSIRDLVQRLTSLPVIVVPSHLHFDHVGRISEFTDIALLDKPELRSQVNDGIFTETRAQYMLDKDYSFSVHRWMKNGEKIDLGGRQITVVSTPGHTPESVSLIDPANRRMFTGDLVNREVLLLNVPGSSLHQVLWSLHELARIAPNGSIAYEAHSEKPLLAAELQLIARGIDEIVHGRAHAQPVCLGGVPALRYNVRSFPIVFPDAADARLHPLMSVTDTLDLTPGESCRHAVSLITGQMSLITQGVTDQSIPAQGTIGVRSGVIYARTSNECVRWLPDVELSGMSGFCGPPRTIVEVGVGSRARVNRKDAVD